MICKYLVFRSGDVNASYLPGGNLGPKQPLGTDFR